MMRWISKTCMLILCVMAVGCLVSAYREYKPYVEEKEKNIKLQDLVIRNEKEEEERKIDFERLKKINPDICGWIFIPGTRIDYPVLIGEDDREYLEKNFQGKYSKLGSVFAFADTKPDLSEAHICIFAHNMKKPQMFGELKKYKKGEFADEYREAYLYTPEKVEKYRLFSVLECEKSDPLYLHKMERESEAFRELVVNIQRRNQMSVKEEVKDENVEKILTLSTCSEYERTRKRMTVHFVKIEV